MLEADVAPHDEFPVVFQRTHAFGYLVGVALPSGKRPVRDAILERLAPVESDVARRLGGFRQIEWVGGRLAGQIAARYFGVERWEIVRGDSGEPLAPRGFTVSIAHKRSLAIALVVAEADVDIGVDLEDDAGAAREVEHIAFSPSERAQWAGLPDDEQDRARLLAFALKEATYKALSVPMRRTLGYADARVVVAAGRASIEMTIAGLARQPRLDAVSEWYGARVIAAVKAELRSR